MNVRVWYNFHNIFVSIELYSNFYKYFKSNNYVAKIVKKKKNWGAWYRVHLFRKILTKSRE